MSTKDFRAKLYKSGKVLGVKFKYIPKTHQLYVYAYVGSGTEVGKQYKVLLVFNQITSEPEESKTHNMKLTQADEKSKEEVTYYLSRPTFESNVLVRCTCLSFRHEFHWYDARYKALIGPKVPYKKVPGSNYPPKNPRELPGLCKHIIQLLLKLMTVKVITDRDAAVVNYITRDRL